MYKIIKRRGGERTQVLTSQGLEYIQKPLDEITVSEGYDTMEEANKKAEYLRKSNLGDGYTYSVQEY